MRLWVILLVSALAFAYVLPTESLDAFYWARPDSTGAVGLDGRTIWSQSAMYPLIATDRAGRCVAVANRLYIYDILAQRPTVSFSLPVTVRLSPELIDAMVQYGVKLPDTVTVTMNLTLPLPPLVLASVYKTTVVSLHAPYGYPVWATNLGPKANVTAVATDCLYVAVGTMAGELYVLRDGRIVGQLSLDRSAGAVTAAYIYGGVAYMGTSGGVIYSYDMATGKLAQIPSCGGPVYGLYPDAAGNPVALCFVKRERPYLYVYPYGLSLADPVLVTYGIDTPRLASAASQDGRWLFVGVGNELVAIREGRVAWRIPLPARASAVATSWNGSVVAVGTQAGHFYLFRDGVPVVRTDPISTQLLLRALAGNYTGNLTAQQAAAAVKPVTSVAVSFDGQTAALEYWDTVSVLYTAKLPYVVEAPGDCLPLEAAVYVPGTNIGYIYTLEKSGILYVPYGQVKILPLYRYMGDVRCKPERNFTLTIFGDVAEPLVFRYVKQYRVYKQPADLVKGPDWASGPATFSAELSPSLQVQVAVEAAPAPADILARLRNTAAGLVRAVFEAWEVDGRPAGAGFASLAVDVQKPVVVRAVYRVEAPATVYEGDYGINLVDVVVYDAFGNIVDAGQSPRFSVYPVNVVARYKPSYLVSTSAWATVNGSARLYAEYMSKAVFRAEPVVDLRNGTRYVFVKWAETEDTNTVLVETVTGPLKRTPVYVRQYRVVVAPPARVEGNVTWADAGKTIRITIPSVISEQAGVRVAFKNWVINGVPDAALTSPTLTIRVDRPLNITYETKRQYHVSLTTRYGSAPPTMWVDEGGTLPVVPSPTEVWSPPLFHYVFVGWRDVATGVVYNYPQMPYVYGPATYEAVWALDPLPFVAVGGAAGAAVFLVWFLRRRRLRRLMAEIAE
ncbi:hypothetical protein Pogu_2366 [Pyrobaculum oguniense TE7]|uniref:Pyrrolo-quinoline quinone repeat domain-containing protein n=1 Tax=Pyrobaculum oguniense (strain DSM 13380 / JCM 10595 / TE7) TaxID=698757 RepID=H6QBP2_PYROT|nr:hypothetical protein Pogu_2366 [Pyrobaculum oguniense TE7]